MGLDAYVTSVPKNMVDTDSDVDVVIPESDQVEQVAYWRKCRQIQGWMTDKYNEMGGTDPSFNCTTLRLTPDIVEALRAALGDGSLEGRDDRGFFWGGYEFDSADELELRKVLAYIKANPDRDCFYHAWY